ncbi:hypothetical protein MPTK1_1g02390 [Marchantia polymorpha subsp. ruderalis]|uniref:Uncharacterized protein n=2 Tax=Marchantia polymorpha TaxID=3197 RepID=A0AAF6AKQ0_MARPO|nr:hypothetical protein MARPO_0029s0008 [Marchantia polymorpha]BBM97020.1 hypothetical protein Mp_1g02390 [Marchantia polymorpha subsp. ruderalis]|eukprot:PTQ42461.1 hypothetical protein MARPO_0029s0008 [Marchantia polymorpha]
MKAGCRCRCLGRMLEPSCMYAYIDVTEILLLTNITELLQQQNGCLYGHKLLCVRKLWPVCVLKFLMLANAGAIRNFKQTRN